MNTADYWRKRSEQIAQRQFQKADDYTKTIHKEYNRTILHIHKDMEAFYQRFANNNGIVDMAEARRLLNSKELKEFRWTLEEFAEKAKNNADGQWTKQLDNAYFRTRVSRLEALQLQINQQVELLAGSKQQGVKSHLGDAYTDTYYRTLFELQKGTGIGVSFAKIDQAGLDTVLGTKLDGRNWSQRIWDDRTKLKQELYTKLSQSFIRGDSLDRTVQDLAKRMNVSYSRAFALVHTETAFFVEQGTLAGYRESGVVEQYEYLATLDSRTSEICREMDGKVFKVSEEQVGVNSPPLHVHCRSTTVPHFDDEDPEDVGERIARDPKTGKTYHVPADMSYEQWYDKHVVEKYGKDQAAIMEKKSQNETSDWEQYRRYKEILDKDAPRSLSDFQEIKYNKIEEWADTQGLYRYIRANPESNKAYYQVNKEIKTLTADGTVKKNIGTAVKPLPVSIEAIDPHAEKRMIQRGIGRLDAESYMKNAKVMFRQSKGTKQTYYSDEGVATMILEENLLKTAFPKNYYDEGAKAILEVVKKHVK